MNVRPLASGDLVPLCDAVTRLPLLQRYGHTPEALAAALRSAPDQGDRIFVYDDGRGPEGLAWLATGGTLGLGGYLRLIAVAPHALGRQIGTALLTAFEATVEEKSRHAFLLVSDFNTAAQRFYQRHGYRQVGAMPTLILPDVDELIFWKRLA